MRHRICLDVAFLTDKVYYFTYKRTLFLLRIVFLHIMEYVLNVFVFL